MLVTISILYQVMEIEEEERRKLCDVVERFRDVLGDICSEKVQLPCWLSLATLCIVVCLWCRYIHGGTRFLRQHLARRRVWYHVCNHGYHGY